MSDFKAGALALIVRANNSENLGRVVELLRTDSSPAIPLAPEGRGFTQNHDRSLCWVVSGELTGSCGGIKFSEKVGALPQAWLMPLNGDPTPLLARVNERVVT